MLNDNPVLAFLGKRGRGAVVEALRRNSPRALHVRELARLADVAPMVASRAIQEMRRFDAVWVERVGREVRVRLDPHTRAGAYLASVDAPDPPY